MQYSIQHSIDFGLGFPMVFSQWLCWCTQHWQIEPATFKQSQIQHKFEITNIFIPTLTALRYGHIFTKHSQTFDLLLFQLWIIVEWHSNHQTKCNSCLFTSSKSRYRRPMVNRPKLGEDYCK